MWLFRITGCVTLICFKEVNVYKSNCSGVFVFTFDPYVCGVYVPLMYQLTLDTLRSIVGHVSIATPDVCDVWTHARIHSRVRTPTLPHITILKYYISNSATSVIVRGASNFFTMSWLAWVFISRGYNLFLSCPFASVFSIYARCSCCLAIYVTLL